MTERNVYRLESNPDLVFALGTLPISELETIENNLADQLMRIARDLGEVAAAVVDARRGHG